jgi:hypothetical protein
MPVSLTHEMAKALSLVLLSHTSHGLGTDTLSGMGEITLRDGLIVGAAAVGARRRAAWIIEREYQPSSWSSGNVDLTVWRKTRHRRRWFCAAELKWWHQEDTNNAANRRTKLIRDFLRAGGVYQLLLQPDKMALVLLVSTAASWASTVTRHQAGDAHLCRNWERIYGTQRWNLIALRHCPGVRAGVTELRGMGVQIPGIIHSRLEYSVDVQQQRSTPATVRCWTVWKPQGSTILDGAAMDQIVGA